MERGGIEGSSSRRKAYMKMYKGNALSSMEMLYWRYQKKWAKKFAKVKKVSLCKKGRKQYVTTE